MLSSTKDCYPARDKEVVPARKGLSENTSVFRASALSLFFPLTIPAFNHTAVDHAGTYGVTGIDTGRKSRIFPNQYQN
jgi:hypothetical protein